MTESSSGSSRDVETLLATLQNYLRSDVSITHRQDGKSADVTVLVQDTAPQSSGSGDIVFVGVGLRVSPGSIAGVRQPIETSRSSSYSQVRDRYSQGEWFDQRRKPFPATTADEESFGEVLFPGESVSFKTAVLAAWLPYLEIKVEGSVSRRHLFHLSHAARSVDKSKLPFLAETWQILNGIALISHDPSRRLSLHTFRGAYSVPPEQVTAMRRMFEDAVEQTAAARAALGRSFDEGMPGQGEDPMLRWATRYLASAENACSLALKRLAREPMGALVTLMEQLESLEQSNAATLAFVQRVGNTQDEAGSHSAPIQ